MMRLPSLCCSLIALLGLTLPVRAGLYYSREQFNELPSQWRGFLIDQRLLRTLALPPRTDGPVNPYRSRYQEHANELSQLARQRPLTADEAADLGALLVRLGDVPRALDVLREAQRRSPHHFHIVANLGTAWQLQGDLFQAIACLVEAVRLAPGMVQHVEEYQLKLVRCRRQAGRAIQLDDLFGVRYWVNEGSDQIGQLTATERQKLPRNAVALVQQLALWLPADGLLLWQLAELAAVHGDLQVAAAMLDGCVTEFGMNAPELRRRRLAMRAAADALSRVGIPTSAHEQHAGVFKPRSSRPLAHTLDEKALPAISDSATNPLPWTVLAETTIDRDLHPTLRRYLAQLDGKQVALCGFMQPLGDSREITSFMLIEYPVGCWYCETPALTGIVLVELPNGTTRTAARTLIKVVGKLVLNRTDPESFLYKIQDAKVAEVD